LIPLQQLKQVVAQQLKDNAEVPLKVEVIKAPNNMMLIPWIMLCVEHMKNANLNFGLCVICKLILNDFDSYSHVCLSCIAPCHLPKGSLTNQLFHNISSSTVLIDQDTTIVENEIMVLIVTAIVELWY
jgi:hypothetical protein